MMEIRKRAFVGLLGLGLISVGCGSSGGSGTGGTSGGTGGSTSTGTGGTHTTGTGGTSNGTGGAGGSATTVGCATSDAPTTPTIADFASADGGVEATGGGIYTYGGAAAPMYAITGGNLHVTDTIAAGAAAQYVGVGLYFSGNTQGTDCTNASAYTGVQFDISGSLTGGCTMQFSINDSAHSDSTVLNATGGPNDPKAAGPKGSYSPQLGITATQIMSTATTIKVPFTGTGAPAGGSPADPLDPTKIEGVQWQLTVPAAGDAGGSCVIDAKITNVKFY